MTNAKGAKRERAASPKGKPPLLDVRGSVPLQKEVDEGAETEAMSVGLRHLVSSLQPLRGLGGCLVKVLVFGECRAVIKGRVQWGFRGDRCKIILLSSLLGSRCL